MSSMPYDTSVLDQARAAQRAEWERRRQVMLVCVLSVLDEWLPRFGVREAYVFGSLARPGRYHDGSDIDIAVVWDGTDFFDMAGEISHQLGQDIDILPLEQLPFADKIKEEGVKWTAATTD
jgi:predicted nucleotidyltransferase